MKTAAPKKPIERMPWPPEYFGVRAPELQCSLIVTSRRDTGRERRQSSHTVVEDEVNR